MRRPVMSDIAFYIVDGIYLDEFGESEEEAFSRKAAEAQRKAGR